jgi:hypothetical protein
MRQVVHALGEHLSDVETFALEKISSAAGENNFSFRKAVFDAIVLVEQRAEIEIERSGKIAAWAEDV